MELAEFVSNRSRDGRRPYLLLEEFLDSYINSFLKKKGILDVTKKGSRCN
jgi:hypothetical protein